MPLQHPDQPRLTQQQLMSGRMLRHSCTVLMAGSLALTIGSVRSAFSQSLDASRQQFRTGQYAQCLESTQKAIESRAYGREWHILMAELLMTLGRYEQAAKEVDLALLNYPVSIRLLKLGHTANQHCGRANLASEMLARIYRLGSTIEIEFWDPPDLVALGEAVLLLGCEPRIVLEQFFNRALKNDPNCREAYLAAASLALDKQDYELAANQYRKALQRFGDDPDMHYGLAKAFYHSDRGAMVKSLDAALYLNPNHVPALLLLAEHQIDCEDYAAAGKSLDRAAAVNPRHPETWAYRCVLAHLATPDSVGGSKAVEQTRANALKDWPTDPRVDYLIGRKLSQDYRFADGAAYQRQALKFDRGYLPAKIQLAQDLLRLGHEDEGWKLADEVHNQDAYNVQAYNLVNLSDHLSKFKTLKTDQFVVRMDEREAALYGDVVLDLLQQAKSQLCEKYGLELDRTVIVELFPEQQDFAVRTFGLPGGEGFLGVCFGNVITANSPNAEKLFNWQATLWHEFCHVVTLNLTRNKMPRWLSEGISVYEESQRNPTWGQQMNPQYRKMILGSELTPISSLSAAFLNPPSPMHLQFAYYESALVVEFLVEQFGYETLKTILADLAKGEQINTAISRCAAPLAQIEKEFKVFARKRAEDLAPDVDWEQPEKGQLNPADPEALAEWLAKHPNNFWALTLYAKNLLADRKWADAKEPLQKLIALYPEYSGDDNGYLLLAEAHRNLGQTEQERQVLAKLAMISANAIYAYGRLMEIAMQEKNWQEVVENGQRYMALNPQLSSLHWQLGRANEELGRDGQAVESYRHLLLLAPADPADIYYRLGRLMQDKDPAAAKKYVLLALAEAPRFRQAHRLLLKLISSATFPPSGVPAESSKPTSRPDPVGGQSGLPTTQEDAP